MSASCWYWYNCILHSSYNSHLSVLGVKKARQSRDRRRQNVNRVLEANVQRQQSNRFVLIYGTVIPLISRSKSSILTEKIHIILTEFKKTEKPYSIMIRGLTKIQVLMMHKSTILSRKWLNNHGQNNNANNTSNNINVRLFNNSNHGNHNKTTKTVCPKPIWQLH